MESDSASRRFDAFDNAGAFICVAVALFAVWLMLDSALDILHHRSSLAGESMVLAALPIGAGFGYLVWRILHPEEGHRRDRRAWFWLLAGFGLLLLVQAGIGIQQQEPSRKVMLSALQGAFFVSLARSGRRAARP